MKKPLPDGLLAALWWAYIDLPEADDGKGAPYLPHPERVRKFRAWLDGVMAEVPTDKGVDVPFVEEYKRQEREEFRGPSVPTGEKDSHGGESKSRSAEVHPRDDRGQRPHHPQGESGAAHGAP